MLIFGWKQAGVTKIGYKHDFCESCKCPAVIDEWKWFIWGYLFGIPLLPLGYIHTWICSQCNQTHLRKPKGSVNFPKSSAEPCHYCSAALMTHPFVLCAKCNLQFYP
jgi:hypothetical protein